jgi:hypothetical protein
MGVFGRMHKAYPGLCIGPYTRLGCAKWAPQPTSTETSGMSVSGCAGCTSLRAASPLPPDGHSASRSCAAAQRSSRRCAEGPAPARPNSPRWAEGTVRRPNLSPPLHHLWIALVPRPLAKSFLQLPEVQLAARSWVENSRGGRRSRRGREGRPPLLWGGWGGRQRECRVGMEQTSSVADNGGWRWWGLGSGKQWECRGRRRVVTSPLANTGLSYHNVQPTKHEHTKPIYLYSLYQTRVACIV